MVHLGPVLTNITWLTLDDHEAEMNPVVFARINMDQYDICFDTCTDR